ncbi:MAG: CotH kinase family protein, partial [bacterium]|nr:CotH kinase family protein [bacterium]
EGIFHSNFRLSGEGETLLLSAPDLSLLDSVTYATQMKNVSYGRRSDGAPVWGYFTQPTPGATNSTEWIAGFTAAPEIVAPWIFSSSMQVEMHTLDPEATIHYTMDGSEPILRSPRYTQPIPISKTTVLRARAFKTGFAPSPIVTHSIFHRDETALPILSLVTPSPNLFDSRQGIYANPSRSGIAWERPVSAEWILPDGLRGFAVDCGIRIHGGASRERSPKKSFRLYFRSEYGAAKLRYPLFADTPVQTFDTLVLRAGFNDSWGYDRPMQRETAILVSDQVCRNLHADMGQVIAHGTWAELYLNGEWWGIYNLTERLEEDFMESYFGGSEWNLVTDDEVTVGNPQSWPSFLNYIKTNRFSTPQHMSELAEKLDIENFTSYIILNLWVMNYDWPHHNWTASQSQAPGGLWRFFAWDVEYSFGSGIDGYRIDQNTMSNATSENIGLIFNALRQNIAFRDYFWRQLNGYLQTVLSEPHILARLNEQLDSIRPAIPREAEKWGKGMTLEDWEHAAQLARDFISRRTPYVLHMVETTLGPPPVAVGEWSLY